MDLSDLFEIVLSEYVDNDMRNYWVNRIYKELEKIALKDPIRYQHVRDEIQGLSVSEAAECLGIR